MIRTLQSIASKLRLHCVEMTAKSGHPTTCASAAELVTALFFHPSGMQYFPDTPRSPRNDKFVLSKGHAAPLLYAAWAEAGFLPSAQLLSLRHVSSDLEGHPTPRLPFVDVATGSLGQGLSAACGMAYALKYFEKAPNRVYTLLGDGECAEGAIWEAFAFAAHYSLDNLLAIVDVNRLGQSEQSMFGHDLSRYAKVAEAFGWQALSIDGHSFAEIGEALETARNTPARPSVILAKTVKGKGFGSAIEDQLGWHGKPLGSHQAAVIQSLRQEIDETLVAPTPAVPSSKAVALSASPVDLSLPERLHNQSVSTRYAYGQALTELGRQDPRVIALDADMKNSTMTDAFKQALPSRFVECFIAEQNMIGTALGISTRGFVPFASSFAAFLMRAADQVRMCGLSWGNVKVVGSHCGVSIGEDGGSQMGLEDLALFRTVPNCLVLYPSDAATTFQAVKLAFLHEGPAYIRTSRPVWAPVHPPTLDCEVGQALVVRQSEKDCVTIVAAGVTLHEALKAAELLDAEGVQVRVIDLFCIKPLDVKTLRECAQATNGNVLTVEDHYAEGGIHEAVATALLGQKVYRLCVEGVPRSGDSAALLALFQIDSQSIARKVKEVIR